LSKDPTEAQLLLQTHLRELGIDTVLEHRFCETRKWMFDLADLERRIGFECNGHFGGKHGAGWSNDAEKMNTAQMMGWRVLVFANRDVLRGKAKEWLAEHLSPRS
jgi:hypothetical protein